MLDIYLCLQLFMKERKKNIQERKNKIELDLIADDQVSFPMLLVDFTQMIYTQLPPMRSHDCFYGDCICFYYSKFQN